MPWYHLPHILPAGNVTTLAHADIVRLLQYSLESRAATEFAKYPMVDYLRTVLNES